MDLEKKNDIEAIESFVAKYKTLREEIAKVIVGQEEIINQILISSLSSGHCLLVGVPGLAKTLLVNTIAKTLGLTYKRIQFTPDLMPSDIIGSEILNTNRELEFIKGPLFANILLADEINRTPPKTQSALLEAMQEHKVTVNAKTYPLQEPFFVLATQNPIEQEGTYPLPEAQLDRFMFMLWLDYPSFEEEVQILKNTTTDKTIEVEKILEIQDILDIQNLIKKVPVSDNVYDYVVSLVSKTRNKGSEIANKYLQWGAGPRASQYLIMGAKAHAVLNGKYSPDIEDVNAIAVATLRHRIVLNYEAQANGYTAETIIKELIKSK
jgi:MoxR-like ATPase